MLRNTTGSTPASNTHRVSTSGADTMTQMGSGTATVVRPQETEKETVLESSTDNAVDNATEDCGTLDAFLAGIERRAFQMARVATSNTEEALDIVQDAMFQLVQK